MYRIGEFSLLNKVTIKTLRYYDKIGIFKPKVVDQFTGYRYYSEEQQKEFNQIIEYKDLGFSLEEIKNLKDTKDQEVQMIRQKINQLTKELNETREKISILSNKLRGNIMRVELKPYFEKYIIGRKVSLKNRDCEVEFMGIKKEIEQEIPNVTLQRAVLCNLELGYVEENIDAFIGYEIKDELIELPQKMKNLEIMYTSKDSEKLVGRGKITELNSIYSDMIKFAHKNNLQIRSFFREAYTEDEVEIYVDCYDLNVKNEDYIRHLQNHKIITEIDDELVGKYQIREILPSLKWMFNLNKQKSALDTKFNYLELKSDGTTNFEYITWNKRELIIKYKEQNIPEPIYKYNFNGEEYIAILMNESYEYHESQRPVFYLYKKI